MAVLPDLPGAKVEVLVNGNALHEYDDDGEPKPKTVTKYIEAVSDANFEIRYSFAPPFSTAYGVRTMLSVDGKTTNRKIVRNKNLQGPHRITGADSRRDGKAYCAKFRFAELQITRDGEDSSSSRTKQRLASVGLITATFHFIKDIKRIHELKDTGGCFATDLGLVSKKATVVEGLSHSVCLDMPEKYRERVSDGNLVDGETHPFAVFKFKYRSLAALKALHVVPRTPSPVPLEERPEEELTTEELRQLVRRLKERPVATAAEVKQEPGVKQEVHVKNELKREHLDDDDDVTLISASSVKRLKDKQGTSPNDKNVIIID